MKLGILASPQFTQAWNKILNASLSVTTSYKVKRVHDALIKEAKAYEAMRIELAEKYSEKDESGKASVEGGAYKIKSDLQETFAKEFSDLQNMEVTLEGKYTSIPVAELEKSNVQLTASDWALLDGVLELPASMKEEAEVLDAEPKKSPVKLSRKAK